MTPGHQAGASEHDAADDVDRDVRVLAPFAVVLAVIACDPGAGDAALVDAAPANSAKKFRGADPGAFLPSVCLGWEALRLWRRFDPLTVTREELEHTRGTDCEWSVIVDRGKPVVTALELRRPGTLRGFVGASAVEKGAPGYLVGFDDGEFGGSLGWFSFQGQSKQLLLDKNVLAILRRRDHFVVLTTQGHGYDGWAFEVSAYFDHFEVGRMVELPGAPTASAVESTGSVLLATREGLLRLSENFELVQLLATRWDPMSITLDGNIAYVGMQGAVAAVELSGKHATASWFMPP